MNSSTTPSFWEGYKSLPRDIQRIARKQFRLWLQDPTHPSLDFKKVDPFWSVKITRGYRALALLRGDTYYWFFIGNNQEYERFLK